MLLSCCHICDVGRWQQKSPPSWICPLKRSCTWALECSPAWTTLGSPLGLNRWRCCETEPCASRSIHLDGLQPGWSTGTIYDNLVQRNSPLMWGYWCPQLPNELRYVFLYQFKVKIILRTNQLDVLSTAISQPSSLAGCKRNTRSHFADAQTLCCVHKWKTSLLKAVCFSCNQTKGREWLCSPSTRELAELWKKQLLRELFILCFLSSGLSSLSQNWDASHGAKAILGWWFEWLKYLFLVWFVTCFNLLPPL